MIKTTRRRTLGLLGFTMTTALAAKVPTKEETEQALLEACGGTPTSGEIVFRNGTVVGVSLEGKAYAVLTPRGTQYELL